MGRNTPIPEFLVANTLIRSQTARMAATEAVKFFKESFVKQGFTDSSFQPWQKPNYPLAGKRTLYKRGNLMRSVHKTTENEQRVVVIADEASAELHNNGGEITVTEAMKAHFWKAYYEEMGRSKSKNKKTESKKAKFFKYMALKKVGSKMKFHKRQFIGNSTTLMSQLETRYKNLVQKEMLNAFKNIRFK